MNKPTSYVTKLYQIIAWLGPLSSCTAALALKRPIIHRGTLQAVILATYPIRTHPFVQGEGVLQGHHAMYKSKAEGLPGLPTV